MKKYLLGLLAAVVFSSNVTAEVYPKLTKEDKRQLYAKYTDNDIRDLGSPKNLVRDVNGDGQDDLIIYDTYTCGNTGVCQVLIFAVAQGGGFCPRAVGYGIPQYVAARGAFTACDAPLVDVFDKIYPEPNDVRVRFTQNPLAPHVHDMTITNVGFNGTMEISSVEINGGSCNSNTGRKLTKIPKGKQYWSPIGCHMDDIYEVIIYWPNGDGVRLTYR